MLIFLIVLALSLQITFIQNFLIDKTTSYLNQKGNFTTEIGKIKLTWWDVLTVEDFRVIDHRDSLMIQIDELVADFELASILPPGDIKIDLVRAKNANVKLITHEGDSIMNINLWTTELADIFGSDNPTTNKPGFSIENLELRQADFVLLNLNEQYVKEGIDYNHLHFENITANATNLNIEEGVFNLEVSMLSGSEKSSGLDIQKFQTNFTFSPRKMEFSELNLKTSKSQIKDYLLFEYDSPSDLSNFIEDVTITARLDETEIDLKDLKVFAPSLPDYEDQIFFSGEVKGQISNMSSDEILIRLGDKTAIFGSFILEGLPDIDNTYINLSLKNSTLISKDLQPYLRENISNEVNKFKTIRVNADFAGYISRFDTNGEFKTEIGNISGRVRYNENNGIPSLVSNVEVDRLNLGILTGDQDLLQLISLDGRVDLEGNSLENLLVDLDAKVSKLGFKGYSYSDIQTDATYGLDLFRGKIIVNDPNLKINAIGTVDLRQSIDSIRMQVRVDTAILDKLKLTDRKAFFSGNLDLDTKGIQLDDIQGIGRFNDINIGFDDRFLELGDFFFQSLFAGGTRTISLNSDYLVAAASGQFNLEQMGLDLQVLFDQYLSIVINEEQPLADLEKNFSENYSADLNIDLININPIVQLFEPELSISKNTVLEGAFYQTPENTIFNLFTSIDMLKYQNYTASDVNIDFNTSKIINSEDILASFYIYSKAQTINGKINLSNLGLEAIWDQDQMNLDFSLDQDSTQSSARVNAIAKFTAQNTTFTFSPSRLKVLNQNWEFDSSNQIRITPELIEISNLKIFNKDQFLAFEGKVSENPEDLLNLSVNQVDLSILNTLIPQDFSGIADGLITMGNGPMGKQFEGNLGIGDLQINAFPIGDVLGSATVEGDRVLISLENTKESQKTFELLGTMGIENKDLDFDVELNETSLNSLEPFLSKYLSNMGGTASGNLKVGGTLFQPQASGSTDINQGTMTINYLKTPYQLDGSINFSKGLISFQELIILDLNGNNANFRGGISHVGFSNFVLDIDSDLSNFQVLNTTEKDNKTFYGEAYVTGTLELKGSTSNLDINARARSEANTHLYIPLTSDNVQAQEDFIKIINIQDTVRLKEVTEVENRLDIENIRMNFILDITPDALTEIIIDPRTKEGISGRGRGVITMNIDTQGNFSLNGNYEITEGKYNFSLYNVVNKQFSIRPGGRISWYGNPYEGIMDITAEYEENISLQPILTSFNSTGQENSQNNRRYPAKVIMDLNGELLSPDISFGFDFSEFPSSGDFQTTISAFQNKIANDEQEMNRQVFSVILTRSLSPEGQFSGVNTISSSLGQLLSSQLNSFIGQVDKNLEIDFDLNTLDQNALETFQLSVAYTFLDGRLRVSRDGGFTDNNGNADPAAIIGDWQAEYTLTEDGVYRIRIFNRNNFNAFTSLSISKNVATYGVAVSQNVSFNTFSELFKKITRKKEEKLRINDNDDFLRYQDGQDWKPINLDRIEERLDSLQNSNKERFPPNQANN